MIAKIYDIDVKRENVACDVRKKDPVEAGGRRPGNQSLRLGSEPHANVLPQAATNLYRTIAS